MIDHYILKPFYGKLIYKILDISFTLVYINDRNHDRSYNLS